MTDTRPLPVAAAENADADGLIYLYGIVAADSEAAALLHQRRLPGIDPEHPLGPIAAAGLVAVVSRVPAAVFDEAPLNALVADLERLTPYAVRHEAVVRAISGSAVIPMTFATIYRTPEAVAAVLDRRAAEFHDLLARFQGHQEWGVKVFADHARLMELAEAESETLRTLAAQAAAATPGRGYLIARQRDRLAAGEAARLAADAIALILHELERHSTAIVQDAPGPAQPGAEQLALKAALLVADRDLADLRGAVAELQQVHAPRGLRLELSGPWAPYSFVRSESAGDA